MLVRCDCSRSIALQLQPPLKRVGYRDRSDKVTKLFMRRGPSQTPRIRRIGASALPTGCSILSKPMAWQRALGARSISRRVMLSVLGCAAVTGPNPQSNRRGSERRRGASNANHHPLRAVALVRELLEIRATERRSSNYLEACAAFWNPEPLRGWVQQLLREHGLRRGDLAR